MEKVAIYCRLSKEDKDKKSYSESESIQNQRAILTNKAKQENWEIYDYYVDEDYSGSDRERPEFNRMIEDAENRKFDIILCKTQSRFARDNRIVNEYIHERFLEWRIRFVTVVDNIDTISSLNKLNSNLIAVFDEYMLDNLSRNIKSTLRRKKEDGQFTGSMPPYGYKKDKNDKNHLVIDDEAAQVVHMIFELVADGKTYKEIAFKLNSEGVLTPKQYKLSKGYPVQNMYKRSNYQTNKWSRDMVRAFIKNEVYIGNMIQGKSRVVNFRTNTKEQVPKTEWIRCVGTHEPIIEKELWDTVQNIISNRRRCQGSDGTKHPLSGKVFCGVCGNKFYKCKSGGIEYFACHGARDVGDEVCINHSRMRLDLLEEYVIGKINEVLSKYHDNELLMGNVSDVNRLEVRLSNYLSRRSSLESTLKNEENKLVTLYEDKLNGKILPRIFDSLQNKFLIKEKEITENIARIDAEIENIKQTMKESEDKESILNKYTKIDELSVLVVDEFIDSIVIGEVDKEKKTRDIIINLTV